MRFTPNARKLGVFSSAATVVLLVAYAVTLMLGLLSLASADETIADPLFSTLEILIIIMMPMMVAQMVAVHAWASAHVKVFSFIAVAFMVLLCGVTCGVHFVILTISHQAAFVGQSWLPLLEFKWPSVVYALDILGWDVFFPLAMLFAAPAFSGSRLASWIRSLMIASGLLAFAGLIGVVSADMQLRNIGIVGYVGVFLVVAVLLTALFYQSEPVSEKL